jgi:hypothetical protein
MPILRSKSASSASSCDFGCSVGVGEAGGQLHLTSKCRILRLELNDFRNLLAGHQSDKSPFESVGVLGGFALSVDAQGLGT